MLDYQKERRVQNNCTIITLKNVTRQLHGPPAVTLVEDISLEINEGEFVAITGPSGSGKSSLLYLMGLLDRPSYGTVELNGRVTNKLSDMELARLRLSTIGYVFQFHFLLPEFSVLENVMLPMRRLGQLEEIAMIRHAEATLDKLGIAECRYKKPGQLSGGESQRTAIARALANDPMVILADEPTGNLDTKNSRVVFETFRDLVSADGRAVVAVTHDPEMSALCSRRMRLVDGRIDAKENFH